MNQEIHVDVMLRDAGSMKATADVTVQTGLGPMTVLGFKVIEAEPGKPWVSPPSKEYQAGGQRRFQKMVELPKPAMKAIQQEVLKAFKAKQG